MISQKLNDQITRIGPGSEAGAVHRRYWQPAALTDEMTPGMSKLPVNLLGERLVLLRGADGTLTLTARVASPDEAPTHHPAEADLHPIAGAPVYPVVEKNGIYFAYLGEGAPPAFPNFDCFRAPDSHVFAFKGLWECNWLQALEIGIDPGHASFLHRFLQDEDPADSYGKQFRDKAADTNMPITQVLREYPRPDIEVEETDFGLKITSLRHMDGGLTHVRVTNQIFPSAICIPMSREMIITQWHVPVDDENCYWVTMFTSFDKPVNKALMREQRLQEHSLPDYAPLKNKSNDYHYNPEEQKTETYTGMGLDINVHDQWAVEGMGAIQDRTREHLGRGDAAIVRYRLLLRKAIKAVGAGQFDRLPMQDQPGTASLIGPLSNDAIADSDDWQAASWKYDMTRRAACPWDASV
ncbi:aromatic ring-hydroxylating dioxygenase subunit alpha [Alloyangia pacifica]|uniref:Phenylpropionate dioxygenase, large terminal subunit n=1 Tax=Alloyangia pacifica TaxID=311180 RepID=A0A1I6WFJ7_9RHOB|nr:aromatic ring-hydroxylating dioxygenase subunit alpha [Alloyangia pacifica]SDI71390.1 Phenylpropionate dioxygenase, large terminal subunit [Alloyangia pacifica]SFT24769.1 Phenylpropionate dioxygenase, large terminal subunit [Alloyangia pacifica]